MNSELWTPQRQQLKTMTEDWMDRHMGSDWRAAFDHEEDCGVQAILKWYGQSCYFLMTASQKQRQSETLTEQLYRDSYGTALLDCGRNLLRDFVEKRLKTLENQYELNIVNKRCKLCGPGLGGVPLDAMKVLYDRLEGWRIGISINEFGILMPEKSCGGWYELWKDDCETAEFDGMCQRGTGCWLCDLRGKSCSNGERK